MKQHDVPIPLAGLALYRGDQALFQQHDAIPGVLTLTREEFSELQDVWERRGLPRDLYFPAHAVRMEGVAVAEYGGIIQENRAYTPLEWEHRDAEVLSAAQLPTEEERRRAFVRADATFIQAILLRMAELKELGGMPDDAQIQTLARLLGEVNRTIRQVARQASAQGDDGDGPEAENGADRVLPQAEPEDKL